MRLPLADCVEITKSKIIQYLLASTHRAGRGKARFFSSMGFVVSEWERLAQALQQHAKENEVTFSEQTPFGIRYVIEGRLVAPDGRQLHVRTVWFIDDGGRVPRFITAYPLKRRMS